jgi:hypothetical protein
MNIIKQFLVMIGISLFSYNFLFSSESSSSLTPYRHLSVAPSQLVVQELDNGDKIVELRIPHDASIIEDIASRYVLTDNTFKK